MFQKKKDDNVKISYGPPKQHAGSQATGTWVILVVGSWPQFFRKLIRSN